MVMRFEGINYEAFRFTSTSLGLFGTLSCDLRSVFIKEVYALNAFKEAIYEDPLLVMPNWNVLDADPCDWFGISCSIARDHVLKLNISGSALRGFLAPELGLLSALQELILHGNNLIGAIPKEFGKLNYLQVLDLGMNQLVGPIPPELGNCTSLMTINLESNVLTRELPSELGNLNYLEELRQDRNKLRGTIPGNNNSASNSSIYGMSRLLNHVQGHHDRLHAIWVFINPKIED